MQQWFGESSRNHHFTTSVNTFMRKYLVGLDQPFGESNWAVRLLCCCADVLLCCCAAAAAAAVAAAAAAVQHALLHRRSRSASPITKD
jgi:hypothetical protein